MKSHFLMSLVDELAFELQSIDNARFDESLLCLANCLQEVTATFKVRASSESDRDGRYMIAADPRFAGLVEADFADGRIV